MKFTRNDLNLDTFECWIREVVDSQYEKGKSAWPWSAKAKNDDIKEKFHKEMLCRQEKLGFVSRYSGKCLVGDNEGKRNQEFLYDFAWVRWGKDDKCKDILQEVLLVMELEFSDHEIGKGKRGNIKYDFNKLLQADAPYKLMGFQIAHKKKVNDVISEMRDAVTAYQSKVHSNILLFGWPWKDGDRNDDNRRQFIFEQIEQKPNRQSQK